MWKYSILLFIIYLLVKKCLWITESNGSSFVQCAGDGHQWVGLKRFWTFSRFTRLVLFWYTLMKWSPLKWWPMWSKRRICKTILPWRYRWMLEDHCKAVQSHPNGRPFCNSLPLLTNPFDAFSSSSSTFSSLQNELLSVQSLKLNATKSLALAKIRWYCGNRGVCVRVVFTSFSF